MVREVVLVAALAYFTVIEVWLLVRRFSKRGRLETRFKKLYCEYLAIPLGRDDSAQRLESVRREWEELAKDWSAYHLRLVQKRGWTEIEEVEIERELEVVLAKINISRMSNRRLLGMFFLPAEVEA